jgi:hypothetical protein
MCIKPSIALALLVAACLAAGQARAQEEQIVPRQNLTITPRTSPYAVTTTTQPQAQSNSIPGNATATDLVKAAPYQEMASALGAGTLAHAVSSADHRSQLLLEYLPQGETLTHWTRMVTVNLAQENADAAALDRVIDDMRRIITDHGALDFFRTQKDARGRSTANFCYSVVDQHICGVVGEVTPGTATILQLQRQGQDAAISDVEKQTLQELLANRF